MDIANNFINFYLKINTRKRKKTFTDIHLTVIVSFLFIHSSIKIILFGGKL